MSQKYIVEVKTKSSIGKTLSTLGTAAAIGVGLAGTIAGGAKLAGVGRFADRQNIPTTAPQSQEIPAQKQQDKKEPVQRIDLHPETVDFLKQHEGFKQKAYWDIKQYSVGYGSGIHTDGKKVQKGTVVTPEQAHEMLVGHINQRIIPKVKDLPIWEKMNDRQRGGFTSFLYNIGEHVVGSRNHPTLNAAIHSGDVNKLYDAMGMYVHTTKKDPKTGQTVKTKLPGLVKRRAAEREYALGEQK
jgi:GH24 family phage-related lysozyme (muramidase)